ncbi:MAG: DNA mismatch repair endonuclease MutL [Lachnospiraceae bacterium]|nr:DNA mismatch repair endonuclease MutL [Lachnospiraceae bacterium]
MVRKNINVLSQATIDKIAAGEVVERPLSVVKELVENSIDSGASAISVEIKDGGKSLIRVTDNGCGIPKDQLSLAFLRHSTSKIDDTSDLMDIHSLGFRGEALSSISAVSRVELITKPQDQFMGCKYIMEGSKEVGIEEVGAPDGTTIFVHQLFYNTPARKKFLKSDTTEANYIVEMIENLALSHPDISFSFSVNGKEKLHTSGNGALKDCIYQICGKEISDNILYVEEENDRYVINGYIGNSTIARGNRNLENFYINGRYIKSSLLSKAVENAYIGFLMQHQYPFCLLNINTKEANIDVNVHPTKQEVRFDDEIEISDLIYKLVNDRLNFREDIKDVCLDEDKSSKVSSASILADLEYKSVQPFEKNKMAAVKEKLIAEIHKDSPYERQYKDFYAAKDAAEEVAHKETDSNLNANNYVDSNLSNDVDAIADADANISTTAPQPQKIIYEQASFLTPEAKEQHKIIGQLFDTYWMVQYQDKLYIIDQHAAHEKVLYEKTMKKIHEKEMTSQLISPPIIVSLTTKEKNLIEEYIDSFVGIGFQLEDFGGNEYAITGVPGNMFSLDCKSIFLEILNDCENIKPTDSYEIVLEKVASMSCKAAVKGNDRLSVAEAQELIDELLSLDNPYHCPHGRPTIISMSKYELEKKFKRIV